MDRLLRVVQELRAFPAKDVWSWVCLFFRSASDAFDAAIGRLLDTLLAAIASSFLCRYAAVERLLDKITAGHQHADPGADPPSNNVIGAAEIVTQGLEPKQLEPQQIRSATTVSPRFAHAVSRSARVSFVGVAIVLLWWSWPSGQRTAAYSSAQFAAMSPTSVQSIAMTPANVNPGSRDEVVLPTPTAEAPLGIVNPANIVATQVPTAVPTPSPTVVRQTSTDEGRRRQPAFVSMPSLAGVDAADNGAIDGDPADQDSVDEVSDSSDDEALPAVLPIQAELVFEAGQENGATRSEEIVVIAAAPQGATESFLVPTPAGSPTPTPDVPFVKIITVPGFTLPHTGPTLTPTPTATPTPVPVALTPGRLWSNFVPKPASESTHFWIGRSFPSKIASPNYQFGSTAGGRYRIHHGVDTSNPMGTPVRAAVSGEVVHAGWDDPDLLGPYGGFYGNAVVIRLDRRLPVAGGELDVFVLYGHLSQVTTSVGQQVAPNDIVGNVGMTGIAIGPHLHTEVRLGANRYEYSVNPYLWVEPANGGGAVAVRLLSSDGRTWPGARLSLARFEGSKAVWARQIEIYQSMENIGPDPAWGENGAMGSVPPGRYYIIGRINGEVIRTEIEVRSGETTFVELRTKQ
jgi:murein DD-endopeptidase MepM/ murein hydrolase activator NlpD